MRVLIISSVYPTPEAPRIIGGAEVFTRQFAESLAASGDGVEVVRAASTPDQPMEIANGVRKLHVASYTTGEITLLYERDRRLVLVQVDPTSFTKRKEQEVDVPQLNLK